MNFKKKLAALIAAGLMIFAASPLVLAVTPEPADNLVQQDTQQTDMQQTDMQQTAQDQTASIPAAAGTASAAEVTDSKYLTKGVAAFWFIFITVVNTVLSFWIGNRFYRLSKKDNHISAEIRALRKDVEEKFVSSVGGFAEQEVDINNMNESMALDDDGITLPEKQPLLREVSAEEEERFRRWEEAQSKPRNERAKVKSAVKEELEEELDDVKKINRKNYRPNRDADSSVFDEEEPEENLEETRAIKLRGDNAVKTKAKEILGDMFPFKED